MADKNIKTVEIDGLKYSLDLTDFDDLEYWEKFENYSSDDPVYFLKIAKSLLGNDYEKAKTSVRNENGKVTVKAFSGFLEKARSLAGF
jgi:hypothetical protein